jgi:hypothetical protein
MPNEIHVGGNVTGGNVIAGDHNDAHYTSGGGPTPSPPDAGDPPSAPLPRFGFAIDVVGYGTRSEPLRQDIAVRLRSLVATVLDGIGVAERDADVVDTGDGGMVFLPSATDPTRAFPRLLAETPAWLARDNARYRDRMRLRMAVSSGLLGRGPTGLTGPLLVDISRLLDSAALRQEVDRHRDSDLVVLVADALHNDVVRPYLDPKQYVFRRVDVKVKEFFGVAWLWIASAGPRKLADKEDLDH